MKYALFLVLILSGCAFPDKVDDYSPMSDKEGKAIVYLYRTPTQIDSLNTDVPRFFVNGELVGKLVIGGYYPVYVSPGAVKVSYKGSLFGIPFPWNVKTREFAVRAGESYYVKFAIEGLGRRTFFGKVKSHIGKTEIQKTALLKN